MPNINLDAPAAQEVMELMRSTDRMTTLEVCEQSTYAKSTVASIIKELHNVRKIHISGWNRERNIGWVKVYSWGGGIDLPQPTVICTVEKKPVPVVETIWPRCDIAASWMRNS